MAHRTLKNKNNECNLIGDESNETICTTAKFKVFDLGPNFIPGR